MELPQVVTQSGIYEVQSTALQVGRPLGRATCPVCDGPTQSKRLYRLSTGKALSFGLRMPNRVLIAAACLDQWKDHTGGGQGYLQGTQEHSNEETELRRKSTSTNVQMYSVHDLQVLLEALAGGWCNESRFTQGRPARPARTRPGDDPRRFPGRGTWPSVVATRPADPACQSESCRWVLR
jgi:hypothetical protein